MTALKATDQASVLGSFIPAGVIMSFGGGTAPAGWLICDGSPISTTTYAALYAAISTNWGNPGGGTFNLPDLRGRMLRGYDAAALVGGAQANRDPDKTRRIVCNAGGLDKDNVGSVQGMASSIVGDTQGGTKTSLGIAGGASSNPPSDGTNMLISPSVAGPYSGVMAGGSGSSKEVMRVQNDHVHTGDLETRPINANVNFIIKY